MARYPKAKWLEVVGLAKDPTIIPIGVILHVDGGNSSSLYGYFNGPSGGVESTLFVNKVGTWEQYRDTTNEADAQAAGNSWIATDGKRYGYNSVETQGLASGTWNDTQFEELAQFLVWHHLTHGTPLKPCSGPKEPGIGYHRQFNAWNPDVHECPGNGRVAQVPALIKRAQDILNGVKKLMGTFIEPEGTLPGDGVYYVDEQGVWPVNKARWDFLAAKGAKRETVSRAMYNALVAWANPQRVPSAEEVGKAVVAALPPAQTGGLTKQDITDATVAGLKHLGLTVA